MRASGQRQTAPPPNRTRVEVMGNRRLRTLWVAGVLSALLAVTLSACGGGAGGQENKKSATGDSDVTNGQIAFRRYFDPDQTEGAIFTMNPDGSHVSQITHPPRARTTIPRCGLLMGPRSPSIAVRQDMGAGSWSSTSTRAIHVKLRAAAPMGDGQRSIRLHPPVIIAWETPAPPSHPTARCWSSTANAVSANPS